MGCSCSSKTIPCVRLEDSSKKQMNEKFCSFTFENESYEQVVNLGVWTNSSSLLESLFPCKLFTENFSMSVSLTFNLIPLVENETQILDGLLFLSEKPNIKEILKINEKYSKICLKFLLCTNNLIKVKSNTLKTVRNKEEFLFKIANDWIMLETHLKELFKALDKDSDGFIQQEDLANLTFNSKIPHFSSDLAQFLQASEVKNQRKLDISGFLEWFRKGRLGAAPFVDITKRWVSEFTSYFPIFDRDSDSLMREKTSKKSLSFNIDIPITPKSEIKFLLGNSAKREDILRTIINQLDFNIYELWFACQVEYKSELQAKYTLCAFEDLVESLRKTLLSHISSDRDFQNFIITKVKIFGSQILISLAFDINHDSIEEALFFVQDLDEMLRSPKDDFFELKISNSKSLQDLKNYKTFKDHSEYSKVSIISETWKKFSEFLRVRSEFDGILKSFFKLEENIELKSEQLANFPGLLKIIEKFFSPFQKMWKINYQMREIVKGFERDLLPKIEFFARVGNYGLDLEVSDEEIEKLFRPD
jgi:Ca2+-binding EF-hand superfamily protein